MTDSALNTLVEQGVDTLINVCPDNERQNQMTDQEWRGLASKHKHHYVYIPVKLCQYTEQDVKKFKAALAQSSNGAHGFCRTGTRATQHAF
nr:sulfur transferase domain-containing protein [uncultured Glaciecola sp.]